MSATPSPDGPRRFPFSRFEIVLHGVLSILTLGLWLPIPIAVWLYRRGARKIGRVIGFSYGGFLALVTLIVVIALASGSGSDSGSNAVVVQATTVDAISTEAPSTTEAAPTTKVVEPVGDNMNYRSRRYVREMHRCTDGVVLFSAALQQPGTVDNVTLADTVVSLTRLCDQVRSDLAAMDTNHFDDQAALGFYGVDRIKSGFNALLKYLDTNAPSKLIEGRDKITDGVQSSHTAIAEINDRRAVYGLPAIK